MSEPRSRMKGASANMKMSLWGELIQECRRQLRTESKKEERRKTWKTTTLHGLYHASSYPAHSYHILCHRRCCFWKCIVIGTAKMLKRNKLCVKNYKLNYACKYFMS